MQPDNGQFRSDVIPTRSQVSASCFRRSSCSCSISPYIRTNGEAQRSNQVGHERDEVIVQADGEMHRCKVTDVRWSERRKDWEYELNSIETGEPYRRGEWIKQGRMELAKLGPNNPLNQQSQQSQQSKQSKQNQQNQQSQQSQQSQ